MTWTQRIILVGLGAVVATSAWRRVRDWSHTAEMPSASYKMNECGTFMAPAPATDTDAVLYRVDGEVDGGLAISAFAGKGTITFRMCNQTAREITQQTPVRLVWRLQSNPWKWGVEGLTKKDDRPFVLPVTPPILRRDAQGRKYIDCRGRIQFPDEPFENGGIYICEDEDKLPPLKQERK